MSKANRTRLEWARIVARRYRAALAKADPAACAAIDEEARTAGQPWVAPASVPAEVAAAVVTAVLTPAEISRTSGIPSGTIYSWISRGLLQRANDPDSGEPAKYLVRDAVDLEARNRVSRLDTA